jgi:hypothetical protein
MRLPTLISRVPFFAIGLSALLIVCCAGRGSAQPRQARSVVLLQHHAASTSDAARVERERALRLELQARDIALLVAVSSPRLEGEGEAPFASTATALLVRSGAAAVLWLESDPVRPVSWVFVRKRGSTELGKAPIPRSPQANDANDANDTNDANDANDPQLFALAAASLLDQMLREPAVVAAPVPAPTPAAVAAAAAPTTAPTPLPPKDPPAPRASPSRYFVQLGFVLPITTVHRGMEAASDPAADRVFGEQELTENGERVTRYYFNDTLAHVPDADSFDDYENSEFGISRGVTPLSASCEADGIETSAGELPSKYCARVDNPGFVFVPALRLALGLWLTRELALALVYQWHFSIEPQTFFGAQAIALEGQYVFLGDRTLGASLAFLIELGVGRTETPVEGSEGRETVNALAGPLEATAGVALRYAFSNGLSAIGSLSSGGRFPESQLAVDLALVAEYRF